MAASPKTSTQEFPTENSCLEFHRGVSVEEHLLFLWHWGPIPPKNSLANQRPPYKDPDTLSVHTEYEDYDAAKHNPVFYGKMHKKIIVADVDVTKECDPAVHHPSVVGHTLVDKPPKSPPPPPPPKPDLKTCSSRDYLETYIFPWLLPALEEMLRQAKVEKCFERKRTKFNGCDFLTEHLYSHNPNHDREETQLGEIPFVKEHWKDHPRPPLPMSLLWTEEEAALIIEAFWKGYKVRRDPDIQELRVWQREWREENANIKNKVNDFWAHKMPEGDGSSPKGSQENLSEATGSEKDPLNEAISKENTQDSEMTNRTTPRALSGIRQIGFSPQPGGGTTEPQNQQTGVATEQTNQSPTGGSTGPEIEMTEGATEQKNQSPTGGTTEQENTNVDGSPKSPEPQVTRTIEKSGTL